VRNVGEDVAAWEIEQIIETVRERMLSRHGEQTAAVVFCSRHDQGDTAAVRRFMCCRIGPRRDVQRSRKLVADDA
jgi:hypothetical protein